MKFRLGFLGAWALFVIALGAVVVGAVAEGENLRDQRRVTRLEKIDALIAERLSPRYEALKAAEEKRAGRVSELRSKVEEADVASTSVRQGRSSSRLSARRARGRPWSRTAAR